MQLLTILVFFVAIFLAGSEDINHFVEQVTSRSGHNDVVFVNVDRDILDIFLHSMKSQPRLVGNGKRSIKCPCNLFVIQNPKTKTDIAEIPCFNQEKYYIVLLAKSSNNVDFQKTSRFLRELGIINAIFVVYDQSNFSVTLFSYNIFEGQHSNLSTQNAVDQLFTSKRHIFRGYRYRVLLRILIPFFYIEHGQLKGFDKQLLTIISEAHHATVEYVERGFREDNVSFVYGDSDRRSTLDLSLFRSRTKQNTSLDRVYLPEWDELCIAVPKRHQLMGLLQLTRPFDSGLWIFIAVYVIFRILWRRVKLRLIVLAFLILKFALTESYLVKVIQFLTDMKYEADPQTIAEVIERKEVFAVYPEEVEVLEEFDNVILKIVHKLKQYFINDYATIHFCKTAHFFEHSDQNFNPQTNDKLIIILKERVRHFASCYGFAKNHPIRSLFERYMRRVFESGIWRWIYDRHTTAEGRFWMLLRPNEYPIDFKDLSPLWVVLGIGLAVSLACFLVEMFRNR